MPLIVPGITPASTSTSNSAQNSNSQDSWTNKLLGKKIGETSDATTFARQDLPKSHRVIEPNSMVTRDYRPDRMNVHVGDDGIVRKVNFN